jgi:hypothetical protein
VTLTANFQQKRACKAVLRFLNATSWRYKVRTDSGTMYKKLLFVQDKMRIELQ